MEVRKCTLEDLDRLALWSMQAEVDMREGSPWGDPEESQELLGDKRDIMKLRLSGDEFDVYEFIEEGTPVGMTTVAGPPLSRGERGELFHMPGAPAQRLRHQGPAGPYGAPGRDGHRPGRVQVERAGHRLL